LLSVAARSLLVVTRDLEAALETYRRALRKLLLGWKSGTANFEVPGEMEATAHMVIPWAVQVHRFGQAFLRLEKDGLEHEAHPTVR
jgi:hypothetical protein